MESKDGTPAPFEIEPPKLVADLEKSKAYDLFDTVLGPKSSQQQTYEACAAGCVEAGATRFEPSAATRVLLQYAMASTRSIRRWQILLFARSRE